MDKKKILMYGGVAIGIIAIILIAKKVKAKSTSKIPLKDRGESQPPAPPTPAAPSPQRQKIYDDLLVRYFNAMSDLSDVRKKNNAALGYLNCQMEDLQRMNDEEIKFFLDYLDKIEKDDMYFANNPLEYRTLLQFAEKFPRAISDQPCDAICERANGERFSTNYPCECFGSLSNVVSSTHSVEDPEFLKDNNCNNTSLKTIVPAKQFNIYG